jgi:hypothetical protein
MINGHSSDREGVTFGDLTRSRELADEEESSEDKCLVHVERHPNGGATVVHLYEEEVAHLPSSRVHGLADVFFREVFQESSPGVPNHVMGIVHGGACHLPELVQYLATAHPDLQVKAGHLRKCEIECLRMEQYAERVASSYCQGTFRAGPLQQVSLVGQVAEESGGYLPGLLDLLEQSPFLSKTLPWGSLSSLNLTSRSHSDDGPILWVRPGEQLVPTAELGGPGTPRKRRV